MDLDPPTPVMPNTAITSGPKKRSRTHKARFTFAAAGAVSFDCKLDSKARKACASPASVKVRPGRHRFEVRAHTGEGLVENSPAKASFRVR
jgi:hypothetical protein